MQAIRCMSLATAVWFVALGQGTTAETPQPISPSAARQKVGEEVWVELVVKTAKDRLEKRGEIYLDSEEDFRDEKNLGIVITRDGALSLRNKNIAEPAEHFRNRTIRVRGKVSLKDDQPRIEVSDAMQVEVVIGK